MSLIHWYTALWTLNVERAIWLHVVLFVLLYGVWHTVRSHNDLDCAPGIVPHIHTFSPEHGEVRYDEPTDQLECKCVFPDCPKWVRVEEIQHYDHTA